MSNTAIIDSLNMDGRVYEDDGGRPYVAPPPVHKKSKYRQDDTVYLIVSGRTEGPYRIETVVSQTEYTLCTDDGTTVNDGDTVEDSDLQPAGTT